MGGSTTASNNVAGIDIIVKKKPAGSIAVYLVDTGSGLRVTSVIGADATEYQNLRKMGELVGGLLSGEVQSATIQTGAQFQVTVTKSLSNIKNN